MCLMALVAADMTNPVYRGIDHIPRPEAVLEAITVRTRDHWHNKSPV
jgi:hypothetical protein